MELIILNNATDDKTNAFIRREKCNMLTIGFPERSGEFMWLIGDKTGKFTNCHHYLTYENTLKTAGIFKIHNGNYQLLWYLGDKEKAEGTFERLTGLKILSQVQEVVEITEKTPEPLPIIQTENPPESFWDCNKESFLEILNNNPENLTLSELIPGSVWVEVDGENYVFGVIYDENNLPMYLCYGFPLPWSETPPEKLEGYCQWIPLDFLAPHDDGFWVIYINAITGERVK